MYAHQHGTYQPDVTSIVAWQAGGIREGICAWCQLLGWKPCARVMGRVLWRACRVQLQPDVEHNITW